MTSSHAGTPQARAKIHTTLTDFEIALQIRGSPVFSTVVHPQPVDHVDNGFRDPPRKSLSPGANYKVVVLHIRPMGL